MGKFNGLLLVSDFDDTVYTSTRVIPERNLKAVEYFRSEGGKFTIATGRARRTFAPYRHLLPLDGPVVLSNGSALYDFEREEMLVQTNLSLTAPHDFGELMDAFPSLAIETYNKEDIYVFRPNYVTDGHMKKVGTDYTVCAIPEMPLPWTKAIVQQEYPVLQEAREWLLARYGHLYEAIFSNQYYLEITEKGSTRGGMVAILAERMGIRPENVYCVGDNQNDIPMLEKSAIPFAPSNCSQPVRDFGARVLCSCEEGVIGDIVDILDSLY